MPLIIEAKVDWMKDYDNDPTLSIVVSSIPNPESFYYKEFENLYFSEYKGFVQYFSYDKPGNGFGGATFNIKMVDGSSKQLVGPWSSRSSVMNSEYTPFMRSTECSVRESTDNIFQSMAISIPMLHDAMVIVNSNTKQQYAIFEIESSEDLKEVHYRIGRVCSNRYIMKNPIRDNQTLISIVYPTSSKIEYIDPKELSSL